jgi:hypothetical protein
VTIRFIVENITCDVERGIVIYICLQVGDSLDIFGNPGNE